ncbi:type II toxin-antitoxin system RelE/ParE family toxin [Methylopila sp. M107]|uniref:type II toxin-antitoxin system RelE/ParE family toxin n=1 Tax=Methylopila sp. M107 TaxID=1101190 RepID=UPI000374BBA5|nr:type II toxin-antitoxin system RelE/ParE family toxin [Methylopila sp. M107]
MRLRLTPRAVRELAEIGDYVAERNPVGAARVEAEIRAAFNLIAEHPLVGRSLERGVRRFALPNYPYLIFYRVSGESAEVLSIRHAARRAEFD